MGCVCQKGVLIYQAHMDIIIMLYISILALCYIKQKQASLLTKALAYFIAFISNVIGLLAIDFLFYIIAIAPIFIVELVEIIKSKRKSDVYVLSMLLISVVSSRIIEIVKSG